MILVLIVGVVLYEAGICDSNRALRISYDISELGRQYFRDPLVQMTIGYTSQFTVISTMTITALAMDVRIHFIQSLNQDSNTDSC